MVRLKLGAGMTLGAGRALGAGMALGAGTALVLTGILATPSVARAQDVPPPTDESAALEARTLFEDGVRMSREERWAEALDRFRRSRALVPRPSTLFNIAIALDRLGRARESIAAIDEYLASSDPARDEGDRGEAMRLRVEAQARLAHLTVTVAAADATVELDGAPLDPGIEQLVDPGDHVLVATAPGHRTTRVPLALAPGAHVERVLELAPIVATTSTPEEPARGTSLLEDPVFWAIAGGVVAVGLGVGIGVGVATSGPSQPYGGTTGLSFELP